MNDTSSHRTTVAAGGDARLCVEAIGNPADPATLLIGGATWSMDWWEDELCGLVADRGRLVVRYDERDTGASTSYPVGAPTYTDPAIADLSGITQKLQTTFTEPSPEPDWHNRDAVTTTLSRPSAPTPARG